jgi:TPR repeat protein
MKITRYIGVALVGLLCCSSSKSMGQAIAPGDSNKTATGVHVEEIICTKEENLNMDKDYNNYDYSITEIYIEEVDSTFRAKDALAYYIKKAKAGSADAFYRIGRFYEDGMGVVSDHVKACEYFEVAAGKNSPVAQYVLGDIYQNGEPGVPIDLKRAKYFFALAVKHKYSDSAKRLKDLEN